MNGFTLTTASGGHVAAPTGSMDFNEHNQPRHGHLEGGVKMDSASQSGSNSRQVHGTSPTAELEFTPKGELRHVHMERGVEMHSEDLGVPESGQGPLRVSRTWRSPVADVDFRDNGQGQAEPATIHGSRGVVVTGESQRGKGAVVPSRLAADEVTGELGPGSRFDCDDGRGPRQHRRDHCDRNPADLDRRPAQAHFASSRRGKERAKSGQSGAAQIQSAVLDGHVVLTQTPAAKPGAAAAGAAAGHGRPCRL